MKIRFKFLCPALAVLLGLHCLTPHASAELSAEMWPLENVGQGSAQRQFEVLRSQAPAGAAETLRLESLEIPGRSKASLVRVSGVLVPPQTGGYFLEIIGTDESEFWIFDTTLGDWRLAQRRGNSVKGQFLKLQQGVAQPFEFWTMGSGKVSVLWECKDRSNPDNRHTLVKKEAIPVSALTANPAKEGDRLGSGLTDAFKTKSGLNLDSNLGPDSPWGDPDKDGLLNWQEQKTGTDPMKADAEGRTGLVRWETWRNVPGKYVFDLTRASNFPPQPDEVRYTSRLQIPCGNGNHYGSRLRGLLKAPATGEYTFTIIADDTAELWLGENESAQSKRRIARVDQLGAAGKWTRRSEKVERPLFAEQVARVTLEQGRSYYVEVLHKQDNGADHCAVAWLVPGTATQQVIGGQDISSWQPNPADADDDGMLDAWQESSGLNGNVEKAMRNANADPDHDGLSNYDEWKAGKNPLTADAGATAHLLTCETWENLSGSRLVDLALNRLYPAKASHRTLIDNMDFSDEGENYGCRLRGFLTAPDDGSYQFSISGNDTCVLYLAESDSKFTKRPIAQTSTGTEWRSYNRTYSQQSDPIELKKGQKYYIEVLFKRGAKIDSPYKLRDHSSVAWKRPGRLPAVIDAEFFSPYTPDKGDSDDDDLPDEWESAHQLDPNDPTGANGSWGDSDGDWLENFREFQLGLNPRLPDVHGVPGLALWEFWDNLNGSGLAALKAHPAFPLNPTERKWITRLEGPQDYGKKYGSRLRAFLLPPTTGDYVLALAGDNECEISLSQTESKMTRQRVAYVHGMTDFRQWNSQKERSQISRPVHLEAGKRYFIEVLHTEATISDHLAVAWKIPGSSEFAIVDAKSLAAFARDPNDQDDDDLPDDWERANGLSTNTANGDQDNDGDGLTNREEYQLGTRADLADTDKDGATDLEELRAWGSNPLAYDFYFTPSIFDVDLASYVSGSTKWTMTRAGLLSENFRGDASWKFQVPADGNWLLVLKTELMGLRVGRERVPVVLKVDGKLIARGFVDYGVGKLGTFQALTQYLSSGEHEVSLTVDNLLARRTLRLRSLSVHAPGLKTESVLAKTNHLSGSFVSTRSSPLCLEGQARDLSAVEVHGKSVTEGMGAGHWFADVPLEPQDGPQDISIHFEAGHAIKHTTTWESTNALSGESFSVRVGDSIRIGAWSGKVDEASTVTSSNGQVWNFIGPESAVVTFSKQGEFKFFGQSASGLTGTLTIQAVPAPGFSSTPVDVLSHQARLFSWSAENEVELEAAYGLADLSVSHPGNNTALVSLLANEASPFGVVARAGNNGPILGVQRVNVIGFSDATENSSTTQSASNLQGYKIYNAPLTVTNLPTGGRVDITVLRGGVLFLDGTTFKSIYPEDLHEGTTMLQFLFPIGMRGAFCHKLLVYDRNGIYVGQH